MNKVNVIFLIALVPVVIFVFWLSGGLPGQGGNLFPFDSADVPARQIFIDRLPVTIEIADTQEERTRGLSGRESLETNSGLLFVFDEPGAHGIWMKDMQFPIDIIWIGPTSDSSSSGGGTSFQIVDIKRNARPESFPEVFFPSRSATHVLEVNAGVVDIHGLEIGDTVRL